jgi:hypothetical protein
MKQLNRSSGGRSSATSLGLSLLGAFLLGTALTVGLTACGGGSSGTGDIRANSDNVQLQRIDFGRLVDVYSYQRIDPRRADRRDRFNRRLELFRSNVVISPSIETQPLFDAGGQEIPTANFEYRPFDVQTGHEELVILWDNREGTVEAEKFQTALNQATSGLLELASAYRGQNTSTRPIPVVPRNAAFKLQFNAPLNVDNNFFLINPSAIQLLEFRGDPNVVSPVDAFRALAYRIVVNGDTLILDTTILGGETGGPQTSGMPSSVDNITANIRLAIPSGGQVGANFNLQPDPVAKLNDVDSFGRASVIRDFRSGNVNDGRFGTLSDSEAPMIIANLDMGIMNVDPVNSEITLNKRFHAVPVRGRYPFTEGSLSPVTGLPNGPGGVPTSLALRAGDLLTQMVEVQLQNGTTEVVRLRAEILQNSDVGTVRDDPAFPSLGHAIDGTQGEFLPTVRVRVATVQPGVASDGTRVSFQQSPDPLAHPEGQQCIVRAFYYEQVPFLDNSGVVSDATRRAEYLHVDPRPPLLINNVPVTPGTHIDPLASVSIAFSEPIDMEKVDFTRNLVITNSTITSSNFIDMMGRPKVATLSVVPSRLSDQAGDGSALQLAPNFGHHHVNGTAESYWFHAMLGTSGLTDLAGNGIAIYGLANPPTLNFSVNYTLDPDVSDNLICWSVHRFEDPDEDGTPPGSIDMFGQFRIQNGRLYSAETVRLSRTADNQNLGGISRILRGECFDPANGQLVPANPPSGGVLYWWPQVFFVNPLPPQVFLPPGAPQNVGHVVEPHQPRGSRMMMRYLEDDFSLSYRQPAEYMLDVEQLYWSPFNDDNVLYDVFDRYTMALSHSDKRPDHHFELVLDPNTGAFVCRFFCAGVSSGLSQTFSDNVLQGSSQKVVFEDKRYTINPNSAFRAPTGTKFVPYPQFDHTYTWRDSRLVTMQNGQVVGLGGARDPLAPPPNDDITANIDSPWIQDIPNATWRAAGGSVWVMDVNSDIAPFGANAGDSFGGDFIGTRRRDHDPIALPLLVDFRVFPDGTANGFASGANGFQMAAIGKPIQGYYNGVGVGCAQRQPWPWTRIHSTGGLDPNTNQNITVDPANELVARGGWLKDAGLGDPIQGLFLAPPGDSMINWAQIDLVRKVSSVTFGFIDTLQPNRQNIGAASAGSWPGLANLNGFPDAAALGGGALRISDLIAVMDPPIALQPAGTSVVLELRGADSFANPNIYDKLGTNGDRLRTRGNLLNANYACEAYRYSTNNSGPNGDTARVAAQGLTPYVTLDRLDDIRNPVTGLLPRYLNMRLVMTNNVAVTPAISPSLRSLSLVYRVQSPP